MGNKHTRPHKIKERVSHYTQLFKNFEWNADIKSDGPSEKDEVTFKGYNSL